MDREADLDSKTWKYASFVIPIVRDFIAQELEELSFLKRELGGLSELGMHQLTVLRKLAGDERMREVYGLLHREAAFSDPKRWECFLGACLRARDDFSYERESLKRAADLKEKIGEASRRLEVLLEQMYDAALVEADDEYSCGYIDWPEELFSMPVQRKRVEQTLFGLGGFRLAPGLSDGEISRTYMKIKPLEIVGELKRLARDWRPSLGSTSGSAMIVVNGSQMRHPHVQFVRSFWWELSAVNSWPRIDDWQQSTGLLKAIAAVYAVISDDCEGAIALPQVQYALEIFDAKHSKNFRRS